MKRLSLGGLLFFVMLCGGGAHRAHAQALVNCVANTSTACNSSAQVGTGTQGDPLWKSFGKINENFSSIKPPDGTFYVRSYGAKCDGVTNDSTAYNNATAAALALAQQAGTPRSLTIVGCGTGQSLLVSTWNVTGFGATPVATAVTIDLEGSCLLGETNGHPVIDAMSAQYINWEHLCIKGMATLTPNVGIQIGRITGLGTAQNHYFNRPVIEGSFTFAPFYNYASEIVTLVSPRIVNSAASGVTYGLVQDGYNYWVNQGSITSSFVTLASGINASSMSLFEVLGGQIGNNNTTGKSSAIWLGNSRQHEFHNTYINSLSAYDVTLYQGATGANQQDCFDAHMEGTSVTSGFLITGDSGGATSTTIASLCYSDFSSFAQTNLFQIDPASSITAVTLSDPKIRITAFQNGATVAVMDTPASYTFQGGEVSVPFSANWTNPSFYYGTKVCTPTCGGVTWQWQGNINVGTNNVQGGRLSVVTGGQIPTIGIYAGNANELTFATNGIRQAFVDSSGNFNALGQIIPVTTVGIKGTAAADNAQAGSIGEVFTVYCGGDTTATITVTIASPAVVTWASHPFSATGPGAWECPINFTTSSALPTGITAGTNYYIDGSTLSGDTFQISDTAAHAIAGTNHVNTSGSQSGTQTGWMGALASNLAVFGASGMSITAGDWDCNMVAIFSGVSSVTATAFFTGINTSAGSLPSQGNYTQMRIPSGVIGTADEMPPGVVVRENVSSTTPIYGVGESAFSGGSQNVSSRLTCRRMR